MAGASNPPLARWGRERGVVEIRDPWGGWHAVALDDLPRAEKQPPGPGQRPWRYSTRRWAVGAAQETKRRREEERG